MFSPQRCHLLLRNILAIAEPLRPTISTSCVICQVNYYESLGIPRNSTQEEIKAAYYRLSMTYHPDKNQGSESAAVKFREITQAYEVLGNFRLRKLYDKGIIHTAGPQYERRPPDFSHDTELKPEDDPSTKFYKSRFRKSKVSDAEGRTPIYDFDEWSRQHYGKTFDRRKTAKAKHDRTQAQDVEHTLASQNEILLFSILVICSLVYFNFMLETSYDVPKETAIKTALEEKSKKDSST